MAKVAERYLAEQIRTDLAHKMVFLGGPRQVGKTTLAKSLLPENGVYWNWDHVAHREKILTGQFPNAEMVILDELHKFRDWRNWLKGHYDLRDDNTQILVTGSARLDLYRHGGDSLQGRYHYLRLHPLTVAELRLSTPQELQSLLELGGFPEPYFRASATFAKRWRREYRARLVRDDIAELENVAALGKLEQLMLRLPALVGAPLSVNSLRLDLQLAHKTVARWLDIFARMYAIFRLAPLGGPTIRAVKKEQKHYHWDWSWVPNPASRFENLVACHLLKWVHQRQDCLGDDAELKYFRDHEGREVDFVVTLDGMPTHLIECKLGDTRLAKPLKYLSQRYPGAKSIQVVQESDIDHFVGQTRVVSALKFLRELS